MPNDELSFIGFDLFDPEEDTMNACPDLTMSEGFGDLPLAMTDPEVWANYTDERLYELDKAVRAYIRKMQYRQTKHGGFKTAEPLVFMWIFKRRQEPSDSGTARVLHKLLMWYCTEFRKGTTIDGKKYSRVYFFSKYGAQNKRPYSVRLRIETMSRPFDERGDYDSLEKLPEQRAARGCKNAGMSYEMTGRGPRRGRVGDDREADAGPGDREVLDEDDG